VKIVRSKYKICGVLPNSIYRSICSYIWRELGLEPSSKPSTGTKFDANSFGFSLSQKAGNDRLSWRWGTRNAFSMVETYRGMYQFDSNDSSNVWKLFWKAKDVVDTSISWMRSYYPTSKAILHSSSIAIDPKWSTPKSGWVKLNIDGTVSLSSYSFAIGGVIRDTDGIWLCGYSMSLGKDEMFKIETRSMLEGLQVAWDKGYRQVKLESNNAL
ncbi:hypothetical protein Goklo_014129, partial [Gossypium klotzschianum]|nr:hypothetical protein [Gossypium klotzschianum]